MKVTSKLIVSLIFLAIGGCQSMVGDSSIWPFGSAGSTTQPAPIEASAATGRDVQNPASGVVPVSAEEPIDAIDAQTRARARAEADAEIEKEVRDERFREYARVDEDDDDALFGEYGIEYLYRQVMTAAGYGEDARAARSLLDEGAALIVEAKRNPARATELYEKATDKLKWAAYRWPDSTIEEDALFLRAETKFFTDDYPEASELYSGLLKKYSNTRYLNTVSRRLFAIGQFWIGRYKQSGRLGIVPNMFEKTEPTFFMFDQGIDAFDLIRMYDSRGPLADDSVMASAMAYFEAEDYTAASDYFDTLRAEYPDSEHLKLGHMFGLESKFRVYQGPRYDGTPLDDADMISDQAVFLVAGDEQAKANLRVAMQRVEHEKANRDWLMAQYYDNKKQYRAAGFYYHEIMRNYPNTDFARRSRERYEQIKGLPPEPPNRFEWLTNLFVVEDD